MKTYKMWRKINLKWFVMVFAMIIALSHAAPPSETKTYRRDYEYNPEAKAFYKLHIDGKTNSRVDSVCKAEGASLIVSSTGEDSKQIHGMMRKHPDIEHVWVGRDGKEYEPPENPIVDFPGYSANNNNRTACDVMKRNGEKASYHCHGKLPFICKVNEELAPYSEECGTYASSYIYNSTLGSCYHIPRISYPWNEAYVDCEAQGAHLVVLNSDDEQQYVWHLIRQAPRLPDAQAWFFFNAGFRAYKESPRPREFLTVFYQTLEEAGYNKWSNGEPNNAHGSEYCGTIFYNDGKFNDIDCKDPSRLCARKKYTRGPFRPFVYYEIISRFYGTFGTVVPF